jgi:hypothetical protein
VQFYGFLFNSKEALYCQIVDPYGVFLQGEKPNMSRVIQTIKMTSHYPNPMEIVTVMTNEPDVKWILAVSSTVSQTQLTWNQLLRIAEEGGFCVTDGCWGVSIWPLHVLKGMDKSV